MADKSCTPDIQFHTKMLSAEEALTRLKAGNRGFIKGDGKTQGLVNEARRNQLVGGQEPFAIILGCSDARVPAEIVFDQGLGDLFVIRVAGNIVAPSQIGSIEFAAKEFGTPLVVVLGHSQCGAVAATIDDLTNTEDNYSRSLHSIVDRIRPAVEPLIGTPECSDPEELLMEAVRANIRASVKKLRNGSPILDELQQHGLQIVGAKYSLKRGIVEFLDE